jgi:hypothetical protein
MRETIVRTLQGAYAGFVHMIEVFLPRLVAMLLIIGGGLLIALLFKYIARAILRFSGLDRLSEESGASQALRNVDLPSMTELLSGCVFWITWIGFTLIGVSVLGISELHEQLVHFFQLVPELFVALLIIFAGVLASNFVSRASLIGAVNAGFRSPRLWSGSARWLVLLIAISMALEQIGLANQTVVAAFSILFGALMFALALAFGLGGRDLARQVLERHFGPPAPKDSGGHEPSPL